MTVLTCEQEITHVSHASTMLHTCKSREVISLYLLYIILQFSDLWFQGDAHAATSQLFLDHAIGQLELCPGIELADSGVGKDGDVRNMTLTVVVDRVCM